MRYKLTLLEISKHCNILLSDEEANLYKPLSVNNGKEELSKQVVKTLIPNIIDMIDNQVQNINIEVYLLECFDQIKLKSAKLLKKIENGVSFFQNKNKLRYASLSCCNTIINKLDTAIKNKQYLTSHIVKDIISDAIETIFSSEDICKISSHEKKQKLLAFFEPLIRNGEKYYTKEKLESRLEKHHNTKKF